MLLLSTATAKALDQRNVVVYDALSDDQQKIHVILITIISAYIAFFINLHSNGKSKKRTIYMCCICLSAQRICRYFKDERVEKFGR
jgi:hypothetical protein